MCIYAYLSLSLYIYICIYTCYTLHTFIRLSNISTHGRAARAQQVFAARHQGAPPQPARARADLILLLLLLPTTTTTTTTTATATTTTTTTIATATTTTTTTTTNDNAGLPQSDTGRWLLTGTNSQHIIVIMIVIHDSYSDTNRNDNSLTAILI